MNVITSTQQQQQQQGNEKNEKWNIESNDMM